MSLCGALQIGGAIEWAYAALSVHFRRLKARWDREDRNWRRTFKVRR